MLAQKHLASVEDFVGCLDSDGDGWSDQTDAYPNDSSKHLASNQSAEGDAFTLIGLGLLVLVHHGRNPTKEDVSRATI